MTPSKMSWKATLLTLYVLLSHTSAFPSKIPRSESANESKITWGPCVPSIADIAVLPVQCGNLTVPQDYTEPDSDETLVLELVKVKASKGPKKGSILFNFGGPGVGARSGLASRADTLLVLTGGQYDLIAHDPRGVGESFPFQCYDSPEEMAIRTADFRMGDSGDPSEESVLGRVWVDYGRYGNDCARNKEAREKGELIGTAFTARDLMQIVDAVEEDGLLRYWGSSYGTVLGATVAAMFPDRVDRVLLDAQSNIHEYFNGFDISVWADSDLVFSKFIEQCVLSPDACALVHSNSASAAAAADIERDIYNFLDDMRREPLVHNGTILTHSDVRSYIRHGLYKPSGYPSLALALDSLLTNDLATYTKLSTGTTGGLEDQMVTDAPLGIHCSDKKSGVTTLDGAMDGWRELHETSKLLGQMGGINLACAQWPFTAKERYTGDFKSKTKEPILFVGNSYDTATALRNSFNASAAFEGSAVLENRAFGHGLLQHGSVCTGKVLQRYFADGTLPEHGTLCEAAYAPFEDKSWDDLLPELED